MMIKVFFDEQIFFLQNVGGISRYFAEIIKVFREHPELGIEPIIKDVPYPNDHAADILGTKKSKVNSKISRLAMLLVAKLRPLRKDFQIMHRTFYLFPGQIKRNKYYASTLYDMIPEVSENRNRRVHFFKKFNLKLADLVFSISRSSVKEYHKMGLWTKNAFVITPLGVSGEFSAGLQLPDYLPENYLLFVGNRSGYKRGDWALRLLSELDTNLNLVFVGNDFDSFESSFAKALGIQDRVYCFSPKDSELAAFYSNALCLLHLSHLEGFGLPILEALRSEIPIVLEDNSINHEVSNVYGHFFSFENFDSLVSETKRILETRSNFSGKAGREYSQQFSWYECARLTAEGYKRVLAAS